MGVIIDSPDWTTSITVGDTIGLTAWLTASDMPAKISGAACVIYNGYWYSVGGLANGFPTNASFVAPINPDASVGAWASSSNLPVTLTNAVAIAYNSFLYLIGGSVNGVESNTVYYAPITAGGGLGAWNTSTVLPTTLLAVSAVVVNGNLYLIGGAHGGVQVNTVYVSPISTAGPIGVWTTLTALPYTRNGAGAFTYGNRIFVVGGTGTLPLTTSGPASSVLSAPVNADGTIGAWAEQTSLPEPRSLPVVVLTGNTLYFIGGLIGATSYASVFATKINADGTINQWQRAADLPLPLYSAVGGAYNGAIYVAGGSANGVFVQGTYYAVI